MNIVVVIATYNEADNIETLLNQLEKYKVIVVDDNSPDGTAEIAKKFSNVEVILRKEKLGIASAYREGFIRAFSYAPSYIIQMDAGLTHNPKDIRMLIETAEKFNKDLVGGTRFAINIRKKSKRTYLSLIAAALMRFIGINTTDATCGFRCWKPFLLMKILERQWLSKGFAFQLETLSMATQLVGNKKIAFMPIEYKLTNSTLNWKILLEAIGIYLVIFFNVHSV